jgi:acyl-CoA synthetase (NDP forming)
VGGSRIEEGVKILQDGGILNFSFPEKAVEVVDAYAKWSLAKNKKVSKAKIAQSDKEVLSFVKGIISKAKEQGRTALYYSEAAEVMSVYGVPAVAFWEILPEGKMPKGIVFPVVLKVDSDKVLHKSDRQAVVVGIKNMDELEIEVSRLKKEFPGELLIVQAMQGKQNEIIMGIKVDEIFGPVIVYGLGGIYTEVFKKVDFMIPPMSKEEVVESLQGGVLDFMFKETRGQSACDVQEVADMICGLMRFAAEHPEVKEFDINPLFIYNDRRGACAVDIKIII